MAVVLSNETSIDLKDLKGKLFNEIFVKATFADKTTSYVSFADLCDSTGRKYFQPSTTTDHAELFNTLQKNPNNLYIQVDENSAKRIIALDKGLMFEHTQVSTDLSNNQAKKVYGLQQKVGVVETQNNYNQNTKVFVKLTGDNDFQLVDAKEIYIFVDGISVCLAELNDQAILDAIKNNTALENVRMYFRNREIAVLDKSKYEQETVLRQEKYEYLNQDNQQVLVHQGLDDDVLTTVETGVVKRKYVDYDSADGKDLRVVQTQKYKIDATRQGNHVYVTDKQGKEYFVEIENLFTGNISSPQAIDIDSFLTSPEDNSTNNYLNFVGKPLLLKTGSTYIELAPLTFEQVVKVYKNSTYTPTMVDDKSVVAQPGVYRQTVDGKYFEESQIQPLCYDYADGDAKFTDYLFNVRTASGNRSIIVPRQQFINKSRVQVKVNNNGKTEYVYVGLTDAVRPRQLVRVNKTVESCAVVQTTTTHNQVYNDAVVMKDVNSDDIIANDTTAQVKQQFLEDYKAGNYVVNSTFNQYGEMIEFRETSNRFIMTDYMETVDRNGENTYYQNFKSQTLTLKNGKFEGKATFDRKRANKSYTQEAKGFALTSLQLMFTPLGILTMVALPALPVVSFAAALSIPVARVVNRIRENASKAGVSKAVKDPQLINREKTEQTIFEQVADLLRQTELKFDEGKQQAIQKDGANATFSLNEQQLDAIRESMLLLQEQIDANFEKENSFTVLHVVDGKAEINAQNAYLAHRYEEILFGLNAEIKGLEKQIKRASGVEKEILQERLNEKIASREAMMNDYTLSSAELPENIKAKEDATALLTVAKAMIITKFTDVELDETTKQFVKDLKVDFAKRKIRYKGKNYNSVADLIAAQPQIEQNIQTLNALAERLDITEHKDVNDRALTMPETIKGTKEVLTEQVDELDNVAVNEQTANVDNAAEQELNQEDHVLQVDAADAENPTDENDNRLVEKLLQDLETTSATEQELNTQLENQMQLIGQLLEKENLSAEDVNALNQLVANLNASANALKQQIEDINSTSTTAVTGEDIKSRLSTSSQNLTTFTTNLTKCEENITKLQELVAKKANTEQTAEIAEKINALQVIVSGYQKQISQTIENIVATIENISNTPNVDITEYQTEIVELKTQLQQAAANYKEADELFNFASAELENTEAKIKTLEQQKNEYETKVNSLTVDKQGLETKITKLDERIANLERKLDEKQQLIDSHEGNIYIQLEELNKLKQDLTLAHEKREELARQVDDLNNQVGKLSQQIEQLEKDKAALAEQAERFEQANIRLEEINKQLTENNQAQTTKIGELNRIVESLNNAIEKAEEQLKVQTETLNGKDKQLAENQQTIAARVAEIENLKNKLAEVETKRDELQSAYNNSREELAKQKQTFEQQLDAIRLEMAKKDETIRQLQQETNQYRLLARRLAGEKHSIVQAAEETIAAIDQLLESKKVGQKQIDSIKNKIESGKLYGLKTEVDGLVSSTEVMLSKIRVSYNSAEKSIASLKELQTLFGDEEDEELRTAVEIATQKIELLEQKQKQLKQFEQEIKGIAANFADLKEFVNVTKVKADIEKNMLDVRFVSGLNPIEADVKFLALTIGNFKNAVKQLKALQAGIGGRQMEFDTGKLQEEIAKNIQALQQFIKANYNVFNLCTNEAVKEKYYDKVSSYSKYDHSVVFTMPNSAKHNGGEDPTVDDGLHN